jgi:hypothetical protein
MQVTSYLILFTGILIFGITLGYHYSEEIGEFAEGVRNFFNIKNIKEIFSKYYWIKRKLKKQGIIKRVYCVIDSFSTEPECELVYKDKIYHVIKEQEYINWKIDGNYTIYILKETGEWGHNAAIFVDYDKPNLEERIKNRYESVNRSIEKHKQQVTEHFTKQYKFLKR